MSLPICRTCGKLRVTSTTPPMPLCECEAVPVTAGADDTRALASALRAALDDPARYEWGEGPWEHLGDAERDVRQLLDDLDALAARVEELEAENARLQGAAEWYDDHVTAEGIYDAATWGHPFHVSPQLRAALRAAEEVE